MARKLATLKKNPAKAPQGPVKIDICPGQTRQEGFTGIGLRETAATDQITDLSQMPWGFADDSVDEICCGRYFCTLSAPDRLALLDECWRILKEKAQLRLVVPARGANHAIMDPFYQWPEVCEDFFYFTNREWRVANDYAHYPVECNFDWTYGFSVDADIQIRNEEIQRLAIKHGRNAAHELIICLTKVP